MKIKVYNVGTVVHMEIPVAAENKEDAVRRMDAVMNELETFLKDQRRINIDRWWWEYVKKRDKK